MFNRDWWLYAVRVIARDLLCPYNVGTKKKLQFDETKFPNVKEMCTKLKEQGIRLTLWIHPYINLDSKNAKDPRIRRLMVQTPSGEPVIANWWNGNGYVVDFTNSEATKWFHDQLNKLKEVCYGIGHI